MLMQESSYNLSATNIKCGISMYSGKKDCIIIDYGIGQINHKTIETFSLDRKKLLSNLDYSVEAAAMVLSDFKRMYGKKEVDYWSRYNSSNRQARLLYKNLVTKYM